MLIDGVSVSEETHDARLVHYYEVWDDTYCDHLNDVYRCVEIGQLKLYEDLFLLAWIGFLERRLFWIHAMMSNKNFNAVLKRNAGGGALNVQRKNMDIKDI